MSTDIQIEMYNLDILRIVSQSTSSTIPVRAASRLSMASQPSIRLPARCSDVIVILLVIEVKRFNCNRA